MAHGKKEVQIGEALVRMLRSGKGFAGVVIYKGKIAEKIEGEDDDDVWRRLCDVATRLNPLFIGYSSARARFLHFFPGSFSSEAYIDRERAYKLTAKVTLDQAVPLSRAKNEAGFGERVLAAFRKVNLLAPFERMRVQDLLRGPDADEFVRLCAGFAEGDRTAIIKLKHLLKPHDCAKWTIITYLPFLWRPEDHFFLKPQMVKTFAERVGHRFAQDYRADLHPDIYASLLDLAQEFQREIKDMGPRDMIDVQSFMWTAVEYKEEDLRV